MCTCSDSNCGAITGVSSYQLYLLLLDIFWDEKEIFFGPFWGHF